MDHRDLTLSFPSSGSAKRRLQRAIGICFAMASSAVLLSPLGAATRSTLQNVGGRASVSLDGEWRVMLDPYEVWDGGTTPAPSDPFTVRGRRGPADLDERDFSGALTLQVPGDWNSQRPELLYYEGSVWYRRDFAAEKRPGRRYFLYFGAANYESRVGLNGHELGGHEGGFTPFGFEVTEALENGENRLLVKVNSRRRREGVPGLSFDWWNYGGLTRSVLLVEVPALFVRDYRIGLSRDRRTIEGWVEVAGAGTSSEVEVSLPDLGLSVTGETDDSGRARFSLPAEGVPLWSPRSPSLHRVVVEVGEDRVEDRIGLRTIEVRGRDILLNGAPIFLRGINSHEESPLHPGRAWSREDAETTLGWVRELGGNFVRLAHYPHNEAIVRLADELGLLLWCEIPVYWSIDFSNPHTLEVARQSLSEMIARDRNRAAVILWSVANETPRSEERLEFLSALIATVRELDDSRLVSAALLPTTNAALLAAGLAERVRKGPEADVRFEITLDDPLGDLLDVVGHNAYYGWYYSSPLAAALGLDPAAVRAAMLEAMPTFAWRMPYDKPLVFSEFGAGAKAGLRGSEEEVWTEDYQARAYRAQLAMIDAIPFVRGTAPWILRDFRSPMRQLAGIQNGWNRKGVISSDGRKKLVFEVLRRFYEEKGATWPDP